MLRSALILILAFLALSSLALEEPSQADDYLTAAAIFKESFQYDKAIEILENSSQLKENNELARYLARLYFLSGKHNKALSIFERIKDKNWLDYIYLGLIHEETNQYSKALRSYRRSIELKDSSIALFRSGKIYRLKKDYKKACDFFQKVLDVDSSIRIANFYLGECSLKIGHNEQAYSHLSKAITFYPQNKEIQTLLSEAKAKLGPDYFKTREKDKTIKRKRVKFAPIRPDEDSPLVRVAIAQDLNKFSFSCQGQFLIKDESTDYQGKAGEIYTLARKGKRLYLYGYEDKKELKNFSSKVTISSIREQGLSFAFYVLDIVYGQDDFWQKKLDRAYQGDLEALLVKNELILINILSIEDYLKGILSAEIPASSAEEALCAQAVAARTFAVRNRNRHKEKFFDFCSDVHCQSYHGLSARTKATDKAVDLTRGEILVFNEKPIEAFYHSNCGGCLSADSFGNIEYLEAKIDSASGVMPDSSYLQEMWFIQEPATYSESGSKSSYRWQRVYDREDFRYIFGESLQSLDAINPRSKGDCLRYKEVSVDIAGQSLNLKGDLNIRNYFDKLRSNAFINEIKYDSKNLPDLLIFW
ncbi:MAG: SpoIID/LytB domain-containing protein, partial [Candidatus Omnitrophica bacterium]|nr:SpoIID/LytB domain-containing protein [Candidatus Omnitrophota bacterium]